ncbi:hypothetical protein [Marispirochaeta aestuarii]|uniref:hypothetical protein n=1 Tax=Marispirochaeta aestuarii TaxID=1963862 RepID=UPI00374981E7
MVAALVNTLLDRMNVLLALPFFLDSIFTAVNAALFGIVPGVVTGILTNVFMEIGYGMENLHWQWGLCNAATGLVVGLAAVKGRFGTLLELCIVIAGVTLANSLIGATLAVYLFGGITGSPVDFIVVGLAAAGRSIFSSAFLARIVSNLIDKSIAVVVAYVLYQYVREDKVPYIVGG